MGFVVESELTLPEEWNDDISGKIKQMTQDELKEGDIFKSKLSVNGNWYVGILDPKCPDGRVKVCWYHELEAVESLRPDSEADIRLNIKEFTECDRFDFSHNFRQMHLKEECKDLVDVWSL